MVMKGNPLLIDLHNLRIGSVWKQGLDNDGSTWIEFIPIGSLGPPFGRVSKIEFIKPGAMVSVRRNKDLDGTFDEYLILLSGEHGQSWFLEDKLGSEFPKLLRQMQEQKEDVAIRQQAITTRERQAARGDTVQVQDAMNLVKAIGYPKQQEEDRRRRKFIGGEHYDR
jgi:hypothetical protein